MQLHTRDDLGVQVGVPKARRPQCGGCCRAGDYPQCPVVTTDWFLSTCAWN